MNIDEFVIMSVSFCLMCMALTWMLGRLGII
jgi:hypothetical protein